MHDDDLMDGLLRKNLAAAAPRLSPDFDARVMRAVQPRRLTRGGRMVMAVYALIAVVLMVWVMRDLDPRWIAGALLVLIPLAAGASAYGRRLAMGR
jgi:hypothetical protein